MEVCIIASLAPSQNKSIVDWSESFAAGRSNVGPKTVAKLFKDILFSSWCLDILQNKKDNYYT